MGSPRRRLRVTMFGLLFAFSLFAGRLFQLQAVDAGGYAKAAATGREATAVLHASRGAILAADGTPLAVSVEAYDVTADPTLVARYHEDVDELAAKLAGLFSAAPEYAQGGAPSVSDLQAALTKPNTRYVVLARKASPATCAKIRQLAVSNTSNPKSHRRGLHQLPRRPPHLSRRHAAPRTSSASPTPTASARPGSSRC